MITFFSIVHLIQPTKRYLMRWCSRYTIADLLPDSALEEDDGSQVRIEKIYNIVTDCRYGIHDISRTGLDAAFGLA